MKKRKNILKIAIDSPAAAGAGTLAKSISKHYNLFYLDTGKIYRMIAYLKIKFPEKFNHKFIKSKIRKNCSPKHVPTIIIKVPEIPKTKSGKIVELAVRQVINGEQINNKEAIANPDSLEFFKNLPQLAQK